MSCLAQCVCECGCCSTHTRTGNMYWKVPSLGTVCRILLRIVMDNVRGERSGNSPYQAHATGFHDPALDPEHAMYRNRFPEAPRCCHPSDCLMLRSIREPRISESRCLGLPPSARGLPHAGRITPREEHVVLRNPVQHRTTANLRTKHARTENLRV